MTHFSSTAIIAEDTNKITKTKPNNNNYPLVYTFSKEIKAKFGVETSDLSISEHLQAISIIKREKKEDFLNSKVLMPLQNNKNSEKILLKTVAEQTFKRDASFFYNKMQTVYDLTEHYQFEQSFITITSLKSRRNPKNLDHLANTNAEIKEDFNEFFRALFKQRIFRKTLNSSNRFYLRSNEFTKAKYLHTHFLIMMNGENLINFIDTFKNTFVKHSKSLNLGRTEIVVPYHRYQDLKDSNLLKEVEMRDKKKKKFKALILNEKMLSDDEIKSLGRYNFFYIKYLEKKKSKPKKSELDEAVEASIKDDSVVKYALKYVYKDFKDKLEETNKNGICSVSNTDTLYSISKIRRINFSRFTFPKYLFHGLKDKDGTSIYKKMNLKTLSILHIEKKIEVVLKKNLDFKTVKAIIDDGIIKNRDKYNLEIKDNLCLFTLEHGTEEKKRLDRLSVEYYEIKKYRKLLDKCNDFEELTYFLSDEFGIEHDFEDENIKYTLIAENETLSNKFLKYIIINNERYYYDYSTKYILMDRTEEQNKAQAPQTALSPLR